MGEHDNNPAFGGRSLHQVFASAAAGCAADQELMCHVTIANSHKFSDEASLFMAEIWARMALSQGSTSVRTSLAQILAAQAQRHALANDDANCVDNAAEAITLFDELAEEGDPYSIQALDRFFAAGDHVTFRDAVLERAKEMQAERR